MKISATPRSYRDSKISSTILTFLKNLTNSERFKAQTHIKYIKSYYCIGSVALVCDEYLGLNSLACDAFECDAFECDENFECKE